MAGVRFLYKYHTDMKKIRTFLISAATLITMAACHGGKGNNTATDVSATNANTEQKADTVASTKLKIEFTMADMDGKQVSVADEFAKHKVTVIDFWASWCGPCRQEMPNLVRIYDKYKEQGLGIVGVSLDEDKEQWTNAVKEMGMAWTQLSDLQGWHNSAAQMYGIQAIPFTIIVDKNGRVLDAGLRGEALETFIANKLGQ